MYEELFRQDELLTGRARYVLGECLPCARHERLLGSLDTSTEEVPDGVTLREAPLPGR